MTYPSYFFALFFLPIAIILVFVSRSTFNSWLKFAAWAVPLSILFIANVPVNSNAYMDFFPFYRDDAARLAGEIFAVGSLVLLVFNFVRVRLHEFDEKKQGMHYADADVKDLPLVFAASIGLISTIGASSILFFNRLDFFDIFFIAGFIATLANLYILFYAPFSMYKKVRTHASFGWKLILSLSLLGINIAMFFIAVFRNASL
ncbi:MAG: hypothetical protein ACYCPH_02765 [Minisyncoccota bacterium]